MEKLYQIFIANDAWITIGKGIWVKVEISLASLLAGTLLGALLCFFRMGRNTLGFSRVHSPKSMA